MAFIVMEVCLRVASTAPAVLQGVEISFNTLVDLEACGVKRGSRVGTN